MRTLRSCFISGFITFASCQISVYAQPTENYVEIAKDYKQKKNGLVKARKQTAKNKNYSTVQDRLNSNEVAENKPLKVMLEMEVPSLHYQHRMQKKSRNGKVAFDTNTVKKTIQTGQQLVLSDIKKQKIDANVVRRFSRLYNGIVVTTTGQEIKKLSALTGVKKVHVLRDRVPHITDSIPLIAADQVWHLKDGQDQNINGQGVTVAVLDTGIDYTHSDLGGCFGEGCKVIGGYDYLNGDDDPMDDDGHGTHVAGIIAANGEYKGVAPEATLYAYKVCNYTCPNDAILAAIEASIDPDGDPATDDGVDVVNMSLGGPGAIDDPLNIAVNEASASGTLFVISAGNEGESGFQTVGSPGNAEMALTVGSTEKDDSISTFSSLGPVLTEDYQKPEVVAPGGNINSLAIGQSTAVLSGTSMAAPHVAGIAALVKQAKPHLNGQEIKSVIVSTTEPLNEAYSKAGAGRVNALKAVEAQLTSTHHQIMLGRINRAEQAWQASQTVSIRNTSDKTLVVSPQLTGNFDNAITLSHNLSESIEIAANTAIDVTLNAVVNVDALTFSPNYTHSAALSLVSESDTFSLPIVLLDAVKLSWSAPDYPLSVWVNNLSGNVSYLTEYNNMGEHYVLPGDYAVSAVIDLHDKVSWPVKIVENITEDSHVEIAANDAIHKIEVTSFTDHQGAQQPLEQLQGSGVFIEIAHAPSLERHYHFFVNWTADTDNKIFTQKPVYVSPLSEDFELSYSLLYGDTETYSDDYHLYTHTGNYNGVTGDIDIALDGSSPTKIVFDFDASPVLEGDYFWMVYSNLEPGKYLKLNSWYTSGAGLWGPRTLASKDGNEFLSGESTLTLHSNAQITPRMGLYNISVETNANFRTIASGNIHFDQEGAILLDTRIESLPMNGEGLIATSELFAGINDLTGYAAVRGPHQLAYPGELLSSWTATCDFGLLYRNVGYNLALPLYYHDFCDNLLVHQNYTNFFMGQAAQSRVTNKAATSWDSSFAMVRHYGISDSSSVANGEKVVNVEFEVSEHAYAPGMLSAYINYQGSWQQVTVNEIRKEQGWRYKVFADITLPKLEEAYVTSLKLVVGDDQVPLQTVIISNALVLGGDKATVALLDRDGDGINDGIDTDKDNDGIPDDIEIVHGLNHLDADDAALDLDNDGVSNIEEFNVGTEIAYIESTEDSDGDGVLDYMDAFPLDPLETLDTDGDGVGNNADVDDDNDGVEDVNDVFPLDPTESADTDNDGVGNNADSDDDNDGIEDVDDAFPLDGSEWLDSDSDGIGNNADTDDDNDGVSDSEDAFPFDASESVDTDGDGIGNNADTDDDNDGVADSEDAYPLDASRSTNDTNNNNNGGTNQTKQSGGSGGGTTGFFLILVMWVVAGFRRKRF